VFAEEKAGEEIMDHIRIWKECNIEEIDAHLVVIDDIQGFCPACKKTGIPLDKLAKCPSCGRDFSFATLREKGDSQAGANLIAKLALKAPHLTIIDQGDHARISTKRKSQSLFKMVSEEE
jgi:hypothetical protein